MLVMIENDFINEMAGLIGLLQVHDDNGSICDRSQPQAHSVSERLRDMKRIPIKEPTLKETQALYIKRLEEYLKDDWIMHNTFGTSEGMEVELNNINDGEYDETCHENIKEFEAQE